MTVEELMTALAKRNPKATVILEVFDIHDLCSVMDDTMDGEEMVILVAED